jgi:hypothetical protein
MLVLLDSKNLKYVDRPEMFNFCQIKQAKIEFLKEFNKIKLKKIILDAFDGNCYIELFNFIRNLHGKY